MPPPSLRTICRICNFKARNRYMLIVHRKAEHGSQCPHCDEKCVSAAMMVIHRRKEHGEIDLSICSKCGYEAKDEDDLKSHRISAHGFKCERCPQVFLSKAGLDGHKASVHGEVVVREEKKEFRCSLCKFQSTVKEELEQHRKIHLKKQCPQCTEKFISNKHLVVHLRNAHHMEQSAADKYVKDNKVSRKKVTVDFMCVLCEKVCDGKPYEKEHSFACTKCPKKYKSITGVRFHYSHQHQLTMKCTYCSYMTGDSRLMKEHVGVSHVTELDIFCDQCGKQVPSAKGLARHKYNVHGNGKRDSKKKTVPCKLCKYMTYSKYHLDVHVSMVHNKEKKFMCDQCDYRTWTGNALSIHINHIHLKRKNYVCSMCSYSHDRACKFREHLKTEHQLLCTIKEGKVTPIKTLKDNENLEDIVKQFYKDFTPIAVSSSSNQVQTTENITYPNSADEVKENGEKANGDNPSLNSTPENINTTELVPDIDGASVYGSDDDDDDSIDDDSVECPSKKRKLLEIPEENLIFIKEESTDPISTEESNNPLLANALDIKEVNEAFETKPEIGNLMNALSEDDFQNHSWNPKTSKSHTGIARNIEELETDAIGNALLKLKLDVVPDNLELEQSFYLKVVLSPLIHMISEMQWNQLVWHLRKRCLEYFFKGEHLYGFVPDNFCFHSSDNTNLGYGMILCPSLESRTWWKKQVEITGVNGRKILALPCTGFGDVLP